MNRYLLLAIFAFTVDCTRASENPLDDDVPEEESEESVPVQMQGDSSARHPYLERELYADISGLDLTAKSRRKLGGRRIKEWPSISVIETNTSGCVTSDRVVRMEFQLPLESLSRDITHAELVVDSDDAVSLLSSYVFRVTEQNGEPARGQPRLRNQWLVYDLNEILKASDLVDQRSGTVDQQGGTADQRGGTVTLSVRNVASFNRNATTTTSASRRDFDVCGRNSRKPPTLFLYHDFPTELRRRLRRSTGGTRGSQVRRPRGTTSTTSTSTTSTTSQRSADQGADCHLHQWTVDFHQIGMKWIIAPVLFKVNFCHGVCSGPAWNQTDIRGRSAVRRVTNHALLVARAVATLPQAASTGLPAPSCVPSGYDSMNMIYIDRNGMVRVETFSQVIANSCGCV